MSNKTIIFFGNPEDFNKKAFWKIQNELFGRSICSVAYNINDLNSQIGREEVLGICSPEDAVVCFLRPHVPAEVLLLNNTGLQCMAIINIDFLATHEAVSTVCSYV